MFHILSTLKHKLISEKTLFGCALFDSFVRFVLRKPQRNIVCAVSCSFSIVLLFLKYFLGGRFPYFDTNQAETLGAKFGVWKETKTAPLGNSDQLWASFSEGTLLFVGSTGDQKETAILKGQGT